MQQLLTAILIYGVFIMLFIALTWYLATSVHAFVKQNKSEKPRKKDLS